MKGLINLRLAELGLELPSPPRPAANFRPFMRAGGFVQLAGVAPSEGGRYTAIGKVGRDIDLAEAKDAARLCALNLIANLQLACDGDLDRVLQFVMVRGFVNAVEEFEQVPAVINGASDLIVDVFGSEIGSHARTSIGCATLPSRVAVELDALVLVRE